MRYYITTLGCPKNVVDSEMMSQLLTQAGHRGVNSPRRADVIIVNTCGFIAPARDESYEALAELASHLNPRQKLVAAGCMAQSQGDEIRRRGAAGPLHPTPEHQPFQHPIGEGTLARHGLPAPVATQVGPQAVPRAPVEIRPGVLAVAQGLRHGDDALVLVVAQGDDHVGHQRPARPRIGGHAALLGRGLRRGEGAQGYQVHSSLHRAATVAGRAVGEMPTA